MSDHRIAPTYLEQSSYNGVAIRMLEGLHPVMRGKSPLANYAVVDKTFPELDSFTDCSFSRQIGNTYAIPESLHGIGTGAPDAYIVTANSAVPVADAIRGFYDALDEPTPQIFPIVYDRRSVYPFMHGSESLPDSSEGIVQRFSERLSGADHVCIIDQCICTNTSLQYTALVLRSAGVEHVTAVRGDWYNDAYPSEIDLQTVSAEHHADFMHQIGVKSAAIVFGDAGKIHG